MSSSLHTGECAPLSALCARLHAWPCIAWHAGGALPSCGAFSVSYHSYCSGHKCTVMWKASLINSGNWADKLPSSLCLEENKNNLFLVWHVFVYTLSPLLCRFDTDLFQMLPPVFGCPWRQWPRFKMCVVRLCASGKKPNRIKGGDRCVRNEDF